MKILVTPLDWGLGHATRCIPIIRELLKRNCEVSIGTSSGALSLLKREFSELKFFELTSYRAEYASNGSLLTKLFFQLIKFMRAIRAEHRELDQILKYNQFDLIISDNRYGCYSTKVKSIFITHQINFVFRPSMKWAEGIVNTWSRKQIRNFDQCWIPDLPNQKFSGELTSVKEISFSFIGILSRFQKAAKQSDAYDLLVLISGPEPQRTIFEDLIRVQLKNSSMKVLIVKGKPEEGEEIKSRGLLSEAGHLLSNELQRAIEESEFVIGRSGYSSIMDLATIGKKNIIFVPTPGQPEQEYLARKLMAEGTVYSVNQNQLSLMKDMKQTKNFSGLFEDSDTSLLTNAIDQVL